MRENRMRERFCRHAAEGQVSETLTHDLFSRLTFVSFHGTWLAACRAGCSVFFSRVVTYSIILFHLRAFALARTCLFAP